MHESIDPVETGKKLRSLCKEKGITARDLAMILHLADRRVVYYWFEGRNLPSLDNMVLIASVLNVPIESIIVLRKDPV